MVDENQPGQVPADIPGMTRDELTEAAPDALKAADPNRNPVTGATLDGLYAPVEGHASVPQPRQENGMAESEGEETPTDPAEGTEEAQQ